MKIQELEDSYGSDNYYAEDFRHILESYKTFLKNSSATKPYSFDTFYAVKHVGDLWG